MDRPLSERQAKAIQKHGSMVVGGHGKVGFIAWVERFVRKLKRTS